MPHEASAVRAGLQPTSDAESGTETPLHEPSVQSTHGESCASLPRLSKPVLERAVIAVHGDLANAASVVFPCGMPAAQQTLMVGIQMQVQEIECIRYSYSVLHLPY